MRVGPAAVHDLTLTGRSVGCLQALEEDAPAATCLALAFQAHGWRGSSEQPDPSLCPKPFRGMAKLLSWLPECLGNYLLWINCMPEELNGGLANHLRDSVDVVDLFFAAMESTLEGKQVMEAFRTVSRALLPCARVHVPGAASHCCFPQMLPTAAPLAPRPDSSSGVGSLVCRRRHQAHDGQVAAAPVPVATHCARTANHVHALGAKLDLFTARMGHASTTQASPTQASPTLAGMGADAGCDGGGVATSGVPHAPSRTTRRLPSMATFAADIKPSQAMHAVFVMIAKGVRDVLAYEQSLATGTALPATVNPASAFKAWHEANHKRATDAATAAGRNVPRSSATGPCQNAKKVSQPVARLHPAPAAPTPAPPARTNSPAAPRLGVSILAGGAWLGAVGASQSGQQWDSRSWLWVAGASH